MRAIGQVLESAHLFDNKAGAARMIAVTLKETVTAMRFVFVFDNAAAVATGNLLEVPTPIAPGGKFTLNAEHAGDRIDYANGLYVALSTSAASFVAPGASNEAWFGADITPFYVAGASP